MKKKKVVSLMVAGLALSGAQSVLAQRALNLPPDPGRVLQSIQETERREAERERRAPPQVLTPAPAQEGKLTPEQLETQVVVKGFQLEGVTLLPQEELLELLKPMIGRSLTLPELIRQVQVITASYARKGYVARTVVPEQEVKDGVIRLLVIEGKLGAINVQMGDEVRFSADTVRNRLLVRQKEGEPIRIPDLERGMLLLNDLAGIEARSSLQPGEQAGVTDEIIFVKERPFFSGSVDADNFGVRSVGQNRLGALLRLNNIDGRGGLLTLNAIGMFVDSRVNTYGSLVYQTPIGNDGLSFQVGGSQLEYRLGEQYASLNTEGTTKTYFAGLTYPFIRSGIDNLSGGVRFEHLDLKATVSDKCIPLTDKSVDLIQFGMNFDRLDGVADSYLTASGQLTRGKVRFGQSQTFSIPGCGNTAGFVEIDPFGTAGYFTRLNANASYQRQINDRLSLSAAGNGQYAFMNLDTSQQMMLGGPYGVRAYPTGEAAGDDGLLINLELRYRLIDSLVGAAFYDAGYIRRQHDPIVRGVNNELGLYGAGLGLYYSVSRKLNVGAAVAWRIGNNPLSNLNGTDSDGLKRNPRFWLNASAYF